VSRKTLSHKVKRLGNIRENLFGNTDFKSILTDPDFKEDSVREVIILPLLKTLGYTQPNIVRSKSLEQPFMYSD
jgi:hypothetical protein